MANNILVRAEDKETGVNHTLPYKAYLDVKSRYNLIGQVDESGELIPGDPNLQPQHRRPLPVKSEVADVDKGHKYTKISELPPFIGAAETIEIVTHNSQPSPTEPSEIVPLHSETQTTQEPQKVRNKPGPKPKIKD